MNTINGIAHSYKGKCDVDFTDASEAILSKMLEDSLLNICDELAKANNLTYNKGIDIEYLLGIVGSYLLGIQEGTIDKDSVEPPSKLFEVSLYPTLQNINTEIVKENIDDSDEDTGNNEGMATE